MVRCMRCGASVEGYSQMCENCAAEKKAAEEASFKMAAETSTMTCPFCGGEMLRSARTCPACGRDWMDYKRPITGTGAIERGDFWIRLVAWLIDGLVVGVITSVLTFILVNSPQQQLLLSFLVGIVYHVGWWVNKGATPGKLAMGLRVVDMDGNTLNVLHAVGRYFSYILSAITFGIGYLMIFGEEHMGLHDRVSGSQVVYAKTLPQRAEPGREVLPAP
jgi:uncharacterized RDD family membrane protein YckC